MYFLVVILHIRATSSPLSALVFMSQIIVYTIRLNVPLHMYIENKVTGFPYMALQVLLLLCSIWSLDFFRSVIPPFCVSSHIMTVHAFVLEYIAAFYPIFLILVTYVCIKLHDNNFRPVVCLWRPFHRHFVHFRRRWDSTASIINAFTTILFVSFTLLYTIGIDQEPISDGAKIKHVLYYDPSVKIYTPEFDMFACSSSWLCVSILSNNSSHSVPPQNCSEGVSHVVDFAGGTLCTFVESFHGQYKDGTNGTHDFRMVSASFLILRIVILVLFLNCHRLSSHTSQLQCAAYVCFTCFYAITRPYKVNFMNNVDIVILFLLEIFSLAISNLTYYYSWIVLGSTLLLLVPHFVLILYVCYALAKNVGITHCLKWKYDRCVLANRPTSLAETDVKTESDSGLLPDRLVNPGEYEPVLATTDEHTAAEHTRNKEPDNEYLRRLTPVYTYGSISCLSAITE